jgi:peptidoglycan/xylan/chitin deacetylase (PgdA/CDA1 family)
MKKTVALMYHDVVPEGQPDSSGFRSGTAAIYKLTIGEFRAHMRAIQEANSPHDVLLTFDDGGASFHSPIADILEEHGCRGYFFISTDFIGTSGFVDAVQLRDLHRRGHTIGSHSCSHPIRMAVCSTLQLRREWSESAKALSDILGDAVTTASVPGGHYAAKVGKTAAEAGILTLFNSEPTTRVHTVDGCLVRGRYAIQTGMPAERAAALASGNLIPAFQQAALWNVKKAAKAVGGPVYLKVRELLLNR